MTPVSVPSLEEVADELDKESSEISMIYAAEVSDQARRCHVDPYNAALASALVRRVSRALSMANVPLGIQMDGEGGGIRLGSNDPEVRRLEEPYRKALRRVVVG